MNESGSRDKPSRERASCQATALYARVPGVLRATYHVRYFSDVAVEDLRTMGRASASLHCQCSTPCKWVEGSWCPRGCQGAMGGEARSNQGVLCFSLLRLSTRRRHQGRQKEGRALNAEVRHKQSRFVGNQTNTEIQRNQRRRRCVFLRKPDPPHVIRGSSALLVPGLTHTPLSRTPTP